MMKKLKLLNIGCILLIIIHSYLILVGIIYFFIGSFMPYHVEFTGLTASDVMAYNANLMTLIGVSIRLVGLGNLNTGFLNIIIIIFALKKREKWAWVCVLISSGINIIAHLVLTYAALSTSWMYLTMITCLILWILGIILSAIEIFSSEKQA